MTKEEAIAVLEAIRQFTMKHYPWSMEDNEAIDLAISALSEETKKHQLEVGAVADGIVGYETIKKSAEQTVSNTIKSKASTPIYDFMTGKTDLISRADAVKAIKEYRQSLVVADEDDENFGHDVGHYSGVAYVERNIIPSVPSVSADREYHIEAIKNCYDCEANEVCKMQPQQECIFKIPFRGVGEWKIEPGIGCYCTNCDFDIGNDFDFMEYVNYCPNCGARMENKE